MTVFSLSDYQQNSEEIRRQPQWKGRQFKTQGGSYLDRAKKPLFHTSHSLYHLRDEIDQVLPHDYDRPAYNKVMMPFAEDAAPFWTGGVDRGAFNHSYAPFSVFYYVLREHTNALISICDGRVIDSEDQYNELSNQFNDIFYRVLEGRGRGIIRGYCSEDEMVRIGTLFYMLMVSADHTEGVILDEDRRFINGWSGERAAIDFDAKAMDQYKAKLHDIVMSDMHWQQFMFRYLDLTNDKTLWFFNTPEFKEGDVDDSVHQWFTKEQFVDLVDMMPLITERGGKVVAVVRDTKDFMKSCVGLFDFRPLSNSRWKNPRGLYLTTGFETVGQKYSVITSYIT